MSIVLRDEMYGEEFSPIIPAFFVDGVLWPKINLTAKASVSRNFRFPTLNDLYFLPGGNPDLKRESGWTYDAGLSFNYIKEGICNISGSATWFDSYVKDWIIWLPTTKGFFSPKNIKDVHAYGVELKSANTFYLSKNWRLDLEGTFSWTPSINNGDLMSPADKSVGKQLPYVPEYVANVSGKITYKTFSFLYKWSYYSERYTMSSNDLSLSGQLPKYFMSNITIEKLLKFSWSDINIKFNINNLFNEEYLSVLSRPMPGINFQLFLGITPKW
jgi:iron complex outermembrane receptor protein